MHDFLEQIWLSLTRRALTYCMAVVALGVGVAAFMCVSTFTQYFLSSLSHRVDWSSESAIADGPNFSMEVSFREQHSGDALDAEGLYHRVRQAIGKKVGALAEGTFDVKLGRNAVREISVLATSSDWLKLQPHLRVIGYTMTGRLFTPEDDASGEAVCVITQKLAELLPADVNPVGQRLKVGGRSFRIIGVVYAQHYKKYGLVLISFSAAQPLFRVQPPKSVSFIIKSEDAKIQSEMDSAENSVSQALGQDYMIRTKSAWLDLEEQRYQLSYMRLFLGAVSLLPLVVGLLGMVSMLLANLNNRVREIGLHRALGATRLRQAVLILCEAGLGGLLASLVGIPIGMTALHLLSKMWEVNFQILPGGITIAVLSGTITAVLAGIIPARAAMRISPADSLRAE